MALPLGGNQSPHFFVKLLAGFTDWLKSPMGVARAFPWSRELASYNFRVLVYLDDFLFVSYESYHRLQALLHLLRRLFHAFGVALHPLKCDLRPAREVDFLGFRV